jgi:hypothetical protein
MSSLPDLSKTWNFQGDAAATGKVDQSQLDTQLQNVVNQLGLVNSVLDRVIRDDDTLIDQIVRLRNLHPEVYASLGLWVPASGGDVATATTANIALTGEQTIDGVLTSASRVLVKNQTLAKDNGIYVSAAGAWTRATDADSATELGYCLVSVTRPSVVLNTNGGTTWLCSVAASAITLGTTSLTWSSIFNSYSQATTFAAVAFCSTANLNIASPGGTIDGSVIVAVGDRVLLVGQTVPSQNGIWIFQGSGSAMTRPTDFPSGSASVARAGLLIPVTGGGANAGIWILNTSGTIDTTSLTFLNPYPASTISRLPCLAVSYANMSVTAPTGAGFDTQGSQSGLTTGMRVLLAFQTGTVENGIWIWNGVGQPLTRPADFANGSTIAQRSIINVVGAAADAGFAFATTFMSSWQIGNPNSTNAIVVGINNMPIFKCPGPPIPLPERNVLINGAFDRWQRGTSFAAAVSGAYGADRWYSQNTSAAVFTVSRSTDVPTVAQSGVKFQASYSLAVTTADAAVGAGDFVLVAQPIEGFRWRQCEGQPVAIQFWVKFFKTGTYATVLRNNAGTYTCTRTFVVNSSNTWEKKTVYMPANTGTSGFTFDNTDGCRFYITLMAGSTYQTATGNDGVWVNSGSVFAETTQVNGMDSTSNTFLITGVQVEAASVATPFERRTDAYEEMLCKRYYRKTFPYATAPATNTGVTEGAIGYYATTAGVSDYAVPVAFDVPMRVVPTVTSYNPSAANAKYRNNSLGADSGTPSFAFTGVNGTICKNPQAAGDLLSNQMAVHATFDSEL